MSDLLPANATAQERALSGAIERIGAVPAAVRAVWNADTCPAPMLPWMAWAFSVDNWDQGWADLQKRGVIKQSVGVHKQKGTIGAVLGAVNALGIGAQVVEWHKQVPVGAPYTFRLKLEADQYPVTMATITGLLSVVENTKNLRSHLSLIELGATTTEQLNLASASFVGVQITVLPGD
jgi:phage tail P2-like protein